jgi:sugar/nucleoside kinase (ribokinase family)
MPRKSARPTTPSIVGTGLIALDIILDHNSKPAFSAGGTCANVLVALSYLGWKARAVSRLGIDYAAEVVCEDLNTFGVDTTFAQLEPRMGTPVIVQRMRRGREGRPYHTFSFSCLSCGRRLPSYQPVPASVLDQKMDEIADGIKVAFLDRLSRGTINLASRITDKGGIVVFEPSSVHDARLFKQMLDVCHVVKYSHERLDDYGDVPWGPNMVLEIQTLGRGGARFRHRDGRRRRTLWHHADALPLESLADSCGAGDWFSAGIIHALCRSGKKTLIRASISEINRAISFAQRLSIWNCAYIGPRGGMYSSDGRTALKSLAKLQESIAAPHPKPETDGITARVCGCAISDDRRHNHIPTPTQHSRSSVANEPTTAPFAGLPKH